MFRIFRLPLSIAFASLAFAQSSLGVFDSHGDIGLTPKPGSATFDAARGEYRITGGGANMWATADAFHFVWKRVTGDATLAADIAFEGAGVDAHRKAVLVIRQDLTPGSIYADAAVHGDGLTSLQFRPMADAATKEIRSEWKGPGRVRIERRGNAVMLYAGAEARPSGPQTIDFSGPVYIGLGVCSHNVDVLETAVFSNVRLELAGPRFRSKVAIFDLAAKTSNVIFEQDGIMEAPNWSRDGKWLLVNTGGNLYRLPVDGERTLAEIELTPGGPYRANNDHDLSKDGRRLAFSASSPQSRQSQVFVADSDGSNVKLRTPSAPSYFHGWSPDGKWLAFVGQRKGKYELFRVGASEGEEQRLTSKGAYDDGPEYSPDGRWIYFNSDRSGGWDIWRIPAEGGGDGDAKAERITSDEGEDWFPHISPNGKHMVFLSFPAGTKGHNDRMPGMRLRMLPAPGKKLKAVIPETLTTFSGGQGTINVNSWAPDSKRFAYVIYEPVAPSVQ